MITEWIESRTKDQCDQRADKWAADVLDRLARTLAVRAADLHAADDRYHRDCYSRLFSGRFVPGGTVKVERCSHWLMNCIVNGRKYRILYG